MTIRRLSIEFASRSALIFLGVAVALLGLEVLARWIDGDFPFTPSPSSQVSESKSTQEPLAPQMETIVQDSESKPVQRQLAPQIERIIQERGVASSIDPGLVDEPVGHFGRWIPVDPELKSLPQPPGVLQFDLYNAWNRRFVEATGCNQNSPLRRFPMPIYVFDPPGTSMSPPYRYVPNRKNPLGLMVNSYGFRGPEVPLNKPPGTIRIGFIGASTTVGHYRLGASYPELVVQWLNRIASVKGWKVKFDGINAGRTGLGSTAIRDIARDEVLPFEPDVLIYYEGANQFACASSVLVGGGEKPAPPMTYVWPNLIRRVFKRMQPYSAVIRRLITLEGGMPIAGGAEPSKPAHAIVWPQTVDEMNPDISRPELPLSLPRILADLEHIRADASARGTEMIVSSFVWFAQEGLELQNGSIYDYLNRTCWPYRYADIRRLADFQNRVLARWAEDKHVHFINVARDFPQDPELFMDAIHFNQEGTRIQAWLTLDGLFPYLDRLLLDGRLPRADNDPIDKHPYIGPVRKYYLKCDSTT